MSAVLAVSRDSHADDRSAAVAVAVATLTKAEVRVFNPSTKCAATTTPTQRVLAALSEPDVTLGVLPIVGGRQEQSWPILQQSNKPVILVPEGTDALPRRISKTLIPLDGTPESAAAVAETMHLFASRGVELIVLHVFDASTVPRFWDQPIHAEQAWRDEFLARYCNEPGVRVQLRSGTAADHVLDVAKAERVDLIALGWSQQLDPGRARTMRHTLHKTAVPVLVVPVRQPSEDFCL